MGTKVNELSWFLLWIEAAIVAERSEVATSTFIVFMFIVPVCCGVRREVTIIWKEVEAGIDKVANLKPILVLTTVEVEETSTLLPYCVCTTTGILLKLLNSLGKVTKIQEFVGMVTVQVRVMVKKVD